MKHDEPSPALARPQAAIDLDKLDLSFSPDNQPFEDPTPSTLDGQWHDAATKLDLAKAYQEMGDVEGRARSCRKCCTKATRRRSPKPRCCSRSSADRAFTTKAGGGATSAARVVSGRTSHSSGVFAVCDSAAGRTGCS
jgi:hypothetical protein